MQPYVTCIAIIACLNAGYTSTLLACDNNNTTQNYLVLCNECSKNPNFLNDITHKKGKKGSFSGTYKSYDSCEAHARLHHQEFNTSYAWIQANNCLLTIKSKQHFKVHIQPIIRAELRNNKSLKTIVEELNSANQDNANHTTPMVTTKRKFHTMSSDSDKKYNEAFEDEDKSENFSPINTSSDEEFSEGFEEASEDEMSDFSPVKNPKRTKKNNNSIKKIRKSERKIAGTYYICRECAQHQSFGRQTSSKRFAGIYDTYNSYATNSRVLHKDIYTKHEQIQKGNGALWLSKNYDRLELKQNASLEKTITKIQTGLGKDKDIQQILADLKVKKIAHEVSHELRQEYKEEDRMRNSTTTTSGVYFDESNDEEASSSSSSGYSDSSCDE